MKNLLTFLKATAVGGLIVIIPLGIIIFVLGSLLGTLIDIGNQISPYLPYGWLGNTAVVAAAGVIFLVLICFMTGLFLLTSSGKAIGRWLNQKIAQKIPLYGMLKNLTAQFAGIKGKQFQPVEADIYGSGSWVLGFIMEDLPDGRRAIFVPSIPVATVGMVYYIPEERIRKLDVPMMDVVEAVTQWGVGSARVFEKHQSETNSANASPGSSGKP